MSLISAGHGRKLKARSIGYHRHMSFRIAQKTLERLEWPQVVARLHAHCRIPQAQLRLVGREPQQAEDAGHEQAVEERTAALFEGGLAAVRERLRETSEARALLDADTPPPLGGIADLEVAFRRAGKGGVLSSQQLLDLGAALQTLHATGRFLRRQREQAPQLAALADVIEERRDLEEEIRECIDPSGEVKDDASPALREARSEANQLGAELQRRLARYLQNPDVAGALSDSYYTVRNDRYVLPVRADARSKVRGIVHDASGSGTTLFVEPEAVVELNNRLKQAELAALREVQRVLRSLSDQVGAALESLRVSLEMLASIDLAFARGRLSREMNAVEPAVERDGVFDLPQLRHPLLPAEEAVPNDLRLGQPGGFTAMVISGPNGGGKTVAMKAVALAALFARAGLHVPADPGARVDLVDAILADIGDDQDIRESLSTFSAHMANIARIAAGASEHSLVVLDEVGVGTDPAEGAALAQAVLEDLADAGARVIATTHYNLLKEMAAVDSRFCNASFEFDPETLAPTYRLHLGAPGVSSATAVAARMGMPSSVLERAGALLEREDRRLDRMLSELATSRAALEREQRELTRVRTESETVRDEYRGKLERLQERRDKLFHSMRSDLDRAFADAHAQVAAVIRDLQRGGKGPDAARARQRLQALEEESRKAERKAGLGHRNPSDPQGLPAVDWRRVCAGDRVSVPGGEGVLVSLPDRRGRVTVRVGGAKLVLPAERVRATEGGRAAARQVERVRVETELPVGGGSLRCDLRGERVEEALDRVAEILDQAAREQRDEVRFIHGFGTGALRKAVRDHLQASPYVVEIRPGEPDRGGDGVTSAVLRR
jgi:DNA mismatch repair protein MutS2